MIMAKVRSPNCTNSITAPAGFNEFGFNESSRFNESVQRFSEVPDQLGMAILSVTPENPLLWAFLMENFNLGIAKISVTTEDLTHRY